MLEQAMLYSDTAGTCVRHDVPPFMPFWCAGFRFSHPFIDICAQVLAGMGALSLPQLPVNMITSAA